MISIKETWYRLNLVIAILLEELIIIMLKNDRRLKVLNCVLLKRIRKKFEIN